MTLLAYITSSQLSDGSVTFTVEIINEDKEVVASIDAIDEEDAFTMLKHFNKFMCDIKNQLVASPSLYDRIWISSLLSMKLRNFT